jgi:hypothetical protein
VNRARWLAVQLFVLSGGCVGIDGGAVEARWVLRNARGIAVSCTDNSARISTIAFQLTPSEPDASDPCAEDPRCRFACVRGVGTTPFIVPAGSYRVSLIPLDDEGQDLDPSMGVITPAPITRQVRLGELTNLNVNLIIVDR